MKASIVIAIGSLVVSGVSVAYSIISGKRYKALCDRLNKSIDDLCDKDLDIDISETVVNEIIERKVTEQLNASVPRVEQLIANTFSIKLRDEVKREIDSQYADIKTDVRREIKEQIGRIDIGDAKKHVIADAKDEAARMFREEYRYRMDELVEDASSEVKNIVKRAREDIDHIKDIHEMFASTTRSK